MKIIDFIQKRFKNDCNWTTGNCYYFSIILKNRFPEGKIYYDVIDGHFIFWYQDCFYDWNGFIKPSNCLIEWDKFDEYDSLRKERIVRDCIL